MNARLLGILCVVASTAALAGPSVDCGAYDRHLSVLAKQGASALGKVVDGKLPTEAQMFELNEIAPGRCKQGKVSKEQLACVLGKKVIGEVSGCFANELATRMTRCTMTRGKCSEATYKDRGDGAFVKTMKAQCEQLDGKFGEGPCPMEGAVGACKQYERLVYPGKGENAFTAVTAKKDCEGNGGTFEAMK